MNSKLDKVSIVCEFDSLKLRLTELEDEGRKLKKASGITASEISNLETSTVYTCANMDATTREFNGLKEEVENMKRRNIKLEAYIRRENIKILGNKESAGETNEKTDALVRIMLKKKVKIPGNVIEWTILALSVFTE